MLAEILKEKDLSAYRLSKESGVSVSSVIKYASKNDCGSMPIETAVRLAKVLGMSLDEFWRRIQK